MTQRIPAFFFVFTALIGMTGCGLFGGSKTTTPAAAPAKRELPAVEEVEEVEEVEPPEVDAIDEDVGGDDEFGDEAVDTGSN